MLVLFTPLPGAVRLVLVAALAASLYHVVRHHAFRSAPAAIDRLELLPEGDCAIRCTGSQAWEPCLIAARTVLPWVVILSLSQGWRRRNVVIASDAVMPEMFRRLRVWLRTQSGAG